MRVLATETLSERGLELLRQDFDVSGFPKHAQAVLKGLKKYGMFVADNGSEWLMSIAPDRRLEGLESLARVKGSDFEVVDTGARSVEGVDVAGGGRAEPGGGILLLALQGGGGLR